MICIFSGPKEQITYNNVVGVLLPAASGQVQVLSGHAEAFFLLNTGDVVVDAGRSGLKTVPIDKAECHVKNDEVKIFL